jgi:ADP-ribose pyrophosphatase YjhB (NUDIX family)
VSPRGQVVNAMAVIRRPADGALLVSEHAEPDPFHRPLGGHVELGEYALDAVHRELHEEIGQGLARVLLLGVLENIFPWHGEIAHEIVFLYAAAFSDPAAYEIDEQGIRDEADGRTRVIWRPAGALSPPLYPAGVPGLIAAAPPAPGKMTSDGQY